MPNTNKQARALVNASEKYAMRGIAASDGHYDLSTIGTAGTYFDKKLFDFRSDEYFKESLKNAMKSPDKKLVSKYTDLLKIAGSILILEKKYVH